MEPHTHSIFLWKIPLSVLTSGATTFFKFKERLLQLVDIIQIIFENTKTSESYCLLGKILPAVVKRKRKDKTKKYHAQNHPSLSHEHSLKNGLMNQGSGLVWHKVIVRWFLTLRQNYVSCEQKYSYNWRLQLIIILGMLEIRSMKLSCELPRSIYGDQDGDKSLPFSICTHRKSCMRTVESSLYHKQHVWGWLISDKYAQISVDNWSQ